MNKRLCILLDKKLRHQPSALQSPKINHLILENLKGSYIGILFEQKLFNSLRVTIGGSLN